MTVDMEVALLVLHEATGERLDLAQFGVPELVDAVAETRVGDALLAAADERTKGRRADVLAAAQAFVLGTQVERDGGGVGSELSALGTAMVAPFELDDPGGAGEALASVLVEVRPGDPITTAVLERLASTLDGALAHEPMSGSPQVALSGPAAAFVTMLLELATNELRCRTRVGEAEVGGIPRKATLVEVDVCTNRTLDQCKHAIDPRHWPDCNPYFLSVEVLGQPSVDATGWAGVVREAVGPGINGSVYVTNLSVRYVERPGLAAVAFDLAPVPGDDERVTVDHGFVSVTDEGAHRRVRTSKVYRIEDLDVPQEWLCPLWAKQVAMAGWWCP